MSTENSTNGFVPSEGFIEEYMRMMEVAEDRVNADNATHIGVEGITFYDMDSDGDRLEDFISWSDMALSYADLIRVRAERAIERQRLYQEKQRLLKEEREQKAKENERAEYERLKAIFEPK